MDILQAIAHDNFIAVNKDLMKEFGLAEAVILGFLASQHRYFGDREQLTDDGFFYVTVEKMQEQTTLSQYQQAKVLQNLESRGVLNVEYRGMPKKRYIRLYGDVIGEALDDKKSKNLMTGDEETSRQEVKKLDDIIIKDNKNKKEEKSKRGRAARFTPPTVEEVEEYCQERNNGIDPQHFIDYYSARGWMMGKNKMKDWKASVRTWERADAKDREHVKPREGTFTLKGFYGTFVFPERYKGMSLHACLGAKRDDKIKMTNAELAELEKLDAEQARWLQNLKAKEASRPLF